MLQLGSKPRKKFKDVFEAQGYEVIGIDLDGLEGCLVRDLCEPGVLNEFGEFDVITNFGCTEHCGDTIEEQVEVWRNLHGALKDGGWLISTTPDYPKHGRWLPTTEWFKEFSALNSYSVGRNQLFTSMIVYAGRKNGNVPFSVPKTEIRYDETGGTKLDRKGEMLRQTLKEQRASH